MSNLGRYPSEIGGIADELGQYLSGENAANARRMVEIFGEDGLRNMSPENRAAAVKLIEMTPTARHKKILKMQGRDYYEQLVRARYVALAGANLARIASRFEHMPGMSYRKAASYSGDLAMTDRIHPSLAEIVP